jgi:WD40 repeat protein
MRAETGSVIGEADASRQAGRPLTGTQAPVRSLAFVPDVGTLATGGDDGIVRLWEVA